METVNGRESTSITVVDAVEEQWTMEMLPENQNKLRYHTDFFRHKGHLNLTPTAFFFLTLDILINTYGSDNEFPPPAFELCQWSGMRLCNTASPLSDRRYVCETMSKIGDGSMRRALHNGVDTRHGTLTLRADVLRIRRPTGLVQPKRLSSVVCDMPKRLFREHLKSPNGLVSDSETSESKTCEVSEANRRATLDNGHLNTHMVVSVCSVFRVGSRYIRLKYKILENHHPSTRFLKLSLYAVARNSRCQKREPFGNRKLKTRQSAITCARPEKSVLDVIAHLTAL